MDKFTTSRSPLALTKGAKIRLSVICVILGGFGLWSWSLFTNPKTSEEAIAQSQLLESVYTNGNYIEAGLWAVFSLGFLVNGLKKTDINAKKRSFIATIVFFLFGSSDLVEIQTGGWWKPWWLFSWKAFCVISMLILLVQAYRATNLK